MNITRRTLATVAATTIAVTGLAPAASAQLGGGLGLVERAIATTDCRVADPILRGALHHRRHHHPLRPGQADPR
ncbi:hypothetical protein QP028_02435 [Corynebacterium suedekumii]|nr:hypothetical protein QP028_02435 [Corynebacterium suedekumii]